MNLGYLFQEEDAPQPFPTPDPVENPYGDGESTPSHEYPDYTGGDQDDSGRDDNIQN